MPRIQLERKTRCTRDDRTRPTETLSPSTRACRPPTLMLPPPLPPPKENLLAPRAGCPVYRLRRRHANNAVIPTYPIMIDRTKDGRGCSSSTQLSWNRSTGGYLHNVWETKKNTEHRQASFLKLGEKYTETKRYVHWTPVFRLDSSEKLESFTEKDFFFQIWGVLWKFWYF